MLVQCGSNCRAAVQREPDNEQVGEVFDDRIAGGRKKHRGRPRWACTWAVVGAKRETRERVCSAERCLDSAAAPCTIGSERGA